MKNKTRSIKIKQVDLDGVGISCCCGEIDLKYLDESGFVRGVNLVTLITRVSKNV